MQRSKEYDEFGPWIYEIDNEEDVPPIFRGYYDNDDNYLMLFKVPRKIERSRANPDMDLYDHMVAAHDTYLHIISRAWKGIFEQRVEYDDIAVMKDIHRLLYGELILFTPSGQFSIKYNTVSEEIIQKFIDIIVKKKSPSEKKIQLEGMPVEYQPDRAGSLDMLFLNLVKKLQAVNDGIKLAAYQPCTDIIITKQLKRQLKSCGLALSSTAFIIDDIELIVIERMLPKGKKKTEQHDYSYIYIPLKSITAAGIYEFHSEQHINVLELTIKNWKYSCLFENKNEKIYELYQKIREINN